MPGTHSHTSLMFAVRDMRLVKGADRAVLEALILRASAKQKWHCFPGYERICGDTQLADGTVRRCVRKLLKLGLIKRRLRGYSSNDWTVCVDHIADQAENQRLKDKAARRAAGGEDDTNEDEQAMQADIATMEEWK